MRFANLESPQQCSYFHFETKLRMSMRSVVPVHAAEKQRLDKWLWFARLVKTRKQAVRLVEEGYVRVDSRRADVPAKSVAAGDVLTIALQREVRVLRVLAIGERRGASRDALLLFEDLSGQRPGKG
jgi:ribosome-associated heat shock protein Hsp15